MGRRQERLVSGLAARDSVDWGQGVTPLQLGVVERSRVLSDENSAQETKY